MHRRNWLALAALGTAAAIAAPAAFAQSKEIRVAHVYGKTGPLEAYGKQTATGFNMGLDYATGGTMTVAGTARSPFITVTSVLVCAWASEPAASSREAESKRVMADLSRGMLVRSN